MGLSVGIELTPSRCSLVSLEPAPDTRVRAFHTIPYTPGDDSELRQELRRVLERRTFPLQVRVVVWGTRAVHRVVTLSPEPGRQPERALAEALALNDVEFREYAAGAWAGVKEWPASGTELPEGVFVAVAAADLRHRLRPLRQSGLDVQAVLTPAIALANIATLRWDPPEVAAAYLAMNDTAGTLAIVRSGQLLHAEELSWDYSDPPTGANARVLHRYTFVSKLAPALRRAFDAVQHAHGARVQRLVTCGDLPDLRSLTMPFIEELDVEAETLDSLEGIDVSALPEPRELFREQIATLRLAWAAAATAPVVVLRDPAASRRRIGAALGRAAVVAAAAGAIAAVVWLPDWGGGAATPAPATSPEPARRDDGAPERADARPAESGRPPAGGRAAGAPATVLPGDIALRPPARSEEQSGGPPVPERAPTDPAARTGAAPRRDVAPPADWTVRSILYSPTRRLAVLNDRVVTIGDTVGAFTVADITRDSVVLRSPGGRLYRIAIRSGAGV
jgi:hypothetical protein